MTLFACHSPVVTTRCKVVCLFVCLFFSNALQKSVFWLVNTSTRCQTTRYRNTLWPLWLASLYSTMHCGYLQHVVICHNVLRCEPSFLFSAWSIPQRFVKVTTRCDNALSQYVMALIACDTNCLCISWRMNVKMCIWPLNMYKNS